MGFFGRNNVPRITTLHRVAGSADRPGEVDVVFVHGLNEEWCRSWGFDQDLNLASLLAANVPSANIWSVDYRVDWTRWKGGSTSMYERANGVLAVLSHILREGSEQERPIVLVGHSYGGLLIKKMFEVAEYGPYGPLMDRVGAVSFFATPHNGARLANYAEAFRVAFRTSDALSELQANGAELQQLDASFRAIYDERGLSVSAFQELETINGVLVVDKGSSNPHLSGVLPVALDLNHNAIIRVSDPNDVRVGTLVDAANKLIGYAAAARAGSKNPGPSPIARMLVAKTPEQAQAVLNDIEAEAAADPGNLQLQKDLRRARQMVSGQYDGPQVAARPGDSRVLARSWARQLVPGAAFVTATALVVSIALQTGAIRDLLPLPHLPDPIGHYQTSGEDIQLDVGFTSHGWANVAGKLRTDLDAYCRPTRSCAWIIDPAIDLLWTQFAFEIEADARQVPFAIENYAPWAGCFDVEEHYPQSPNILRLGPEIIPVKVAGRQIVYLCGYSPAQQQAFIKHWPDVYAIDSY